MQHLYVMSFHIFYMYSIIWYIIKLKHMYVCVLCMHFSVAWTCFYRMGCATCACTLYAMRCLVSRRLCVLFCRGHWFVDWYAFRGIGIDIVSILCGWRVAWCRISAMWFVWYAFISNIQFDDEMILISAVRESAKIDSSVHWIVICDSTLREFVNVSTCSINVGSQMWK